MSQGRVRGRGRGYRVFSRSETPNLRPMDQVKNGAKTNGNISHNKICCREIVTKFELNATGEAFFTELKQLWNMLKKSPPVSSKLHNYLNSVDNPYIEVLRLASNSQEFNCAKSKTLPMFIIEEFAVWCSKSNAKVELLNQQLKLDAFKLINKQNSLALTKIVIDTFRISEENDAMLEMIKCMIDKKQYKEACQYAVLFNFQDKFSIEEFLLPMVLQDKLFGVDDFLKTSPKHQKELVIFLDSFLNKPSIKDSIMEYNIKWGVPDIKYEKLHSRPWKKLIVRLCKMFKLPSDITPNLNKRRNEGALNFLLYKRFVENSFGDESWKEMVQEAVGNEESLHIELIHQLAQYGEPAEALRWAHFYNIEKSEWPYSVRMLEENPDQHRKQPDVQNDESWDDEIPVVVPVVYHKISLHSNAVQLIDSPTRFEGFLDMGFHDIDVIGIDCEWKPSFGSNPNELALMQIATRKNVFVLDIVNLGNKVPHLWQELSKFVFNNCDILKLGFNLTGDIQMIRHALPDLNFSTKQIGVLDLGSLWKHLEKIPKFKLPYEVQKGGPSLTTLVQRCLGYPLDKSDQFSNWEKRPLRQSQIDYAALDAYCLIEVYDVIRKCCENVRISLDDICYQLMTNEKFPKKKHKKSNNKKKQLLRQELRKFPSPHLEPVPAGQIKIVCDTMLQGLGRKLRSCGIDSVILETHQDHTMCVRLAQDEQRYIITKGYETYKMLQGYVPSGHCLQIISDDVVEQIKEVIDYYKIVVTKNHVFSRCQACNGNNFVRISRSTMNALLSSAESKTYPVPSCYYEDDLNCEDEATGFSSEEDFHEAGSRGPSVNRKWDLYPDEKVDVGLCQTRLGSKIQVTAVPKPLLSKYDFFYVCEECGKVYWDGTHFEKVVSGRLQGIVQ